MAKFSVRKDSARFGEGSEYGPRWRATCGELSPAWWVWHGGPYVDVMVGNQAVDCLNVWDYALGAPRIERSTVALRAFLAEAYASAEERDELRRMVAETLRYGF